MKREISLRIRPRLRNNIIPLYTKVIIPDDQMNGVKGPLYSKPKSQGPGSKFQEPKPQLYDNQMTTILSHIPEKLIPQQSNNH
jgi:hypothetical protein